MIITDLNKVDKRYGLVYADPAWLFNSKNTGGKMNSGATAKYSCMTLEEMKKLPVKNITADNCLLVMWWVSAMPREAIELAESWGFRVANMNGFIWEKLTKKDNPFFGMGHYTRAGAESALIAIKGKTGEVIKDRSVRQVHKARVGRHSQKPDLFYDEMNKLVGDVEKLEMFGRQQWPSYDTWGNECE